MTATPNETTDSVGPLPSADGGDPPTDASADTALRLAPDPADRGIRYVPA